MQVWIVQSATSGAIARVFKDKAEANAYKRRKNAQYAKGRRLIFSVRGYTVV